MYQQAVSQANIVGLCVGTRPDCVPDAVLDLLCEYKTGLRSVAGAGATNRPRQNNCIASIAVMILPAIIARRSWRVSVG